MRKFFLPAVAVLSLVWGSGFHCGAASAAVRGWLSWRGPQQNGTSLEKGLQLTIDWFRENYATARL